MNLLRETEKFLNESKNYINERIQMRDIPSQYSLQTYIFPFTEKLQKLTVAKLKVNYETVKVPDNMISGFFVVDGTEYNFKLNPTGNMSGSKMEFEFNILFASDKNVLIKEEVSFATDRSIDDISDALVGEMEHYNIV